ncbi:MAG TPA: hypothetical protein VL400_27040, partial [Polyangiaceae bacterium]|nr:hypothetical protein [Polyangiaceae bacterium]
AIGGAAGFHSEAGGLTWHVQEQTGEEASKTFDAKKKETEEILFKKWIKADKTADGWSMTYEASKINDKGDEAGTSYSFSVRKKVGDKVYDCYGGVDKQADLAGAVDSCTSLKAL